jgi:hypothetical protein
MKQADRELNAFSEPFSEQIRRYSQLSLLSPRVGEGPTWGDNFAGLNPSAFLLGPFLAAFYGPFILV